MASSSSIHADIEMHAHALYKKFRSKKLSVSAETEQLFINLFRSVEKLKMFNEKDFEHLWLTEVNEKNELLKSKCGPYASECAYKTPPVAASPASAADAAPAHQILNPEDEDLFTVEISEIQIEHEE